MSASAANRQFAVLTLTLLVLAGGGAYAAWHWGLPWLAASAARLVPVEWERELGSAVAASIAPGAKPCLEVVSRRLEAALPRPNLYRFEIRCAPLAEVNALAAPGGSIVVFQGLLDAVRSEDELAAVLAHEMQHVTHRHTTRAIFRAFALQAVAGMIFGDVTSLLAQVSGGLSALHYQRGDEDEADREGVRLLRDAGLAPMAMPAMLESLEAATRGQAGLPAWLTSHPDTRERIEATRALARRMK